MPLAFSVIFLNITIQTLLFNKTDKIIHGFDSHKYENVMEESERLYQQLVLTAENIKKQVELEGL